MTLTSSQIKKINKMNRASQDPQLGTIIAELQGSSGSQVNITGGTISGVTWPKTNVSVANSPYTTKTSDYLIRCNAISASIVVNLIPSTNSDRVYFIKNLYTSTCVVQVVADATGTPDLIDGESSQLLLPKSDMKIQDGALNNWDVL
jgi:hypothetical protein